MVFEHIIDALVHGSGYERIATVGAEWCHTDLMAGVDGVRGGWVVAVVCATDDVAWHVVDTAAEVLDRTRDCAAVGVDIPMGLPEGGARACDRTARRRLGTAGSAVFPHRRVLRSQSGPLRA